MNSQTQNPAYRLSPELRRSLDGSLDRPNGESRRLAGVFGSSTARRRWCGFTLIELLVVIAIIALLAAMVFPITRALNRTKLRTRARGELAQLETAIEAYKTKVGVYPPDNFNATARTVTPWINQLYFELLGTTAILNPQGQPTRYRTLDGNTEITPVQANTWFHTEGFMNSTKGSGDDGPIAINFFKGLNANQVAVPPGADSPKFIVSSVPWPTDNNFQPLGFGSGLNPWRYNSSAPTNNPGSYDLWLDFVVDGKTNRIGNWSKEPLVVNTPF